MTPADDDHRVDLRSDRFRLRLASLCSIANCIHNRNIITVLFNDDASVFETKIATSFSGTVYYLNGDEKKSVDFTCLEGTTNDDGIISFKLVTDNGEEYFSPGIENTFISKALFNLVMSDENVDLENAAVLDNLDTFDDTDNSSTESKLQSGKVSDFSNEVCERLSPETNIRNDIVELALGFMDKFLVFCDALKRHDTTTVYYPDAFIKTGLRLSKISDNFTQECIDLYDEFKEDFEWFLELMETEEEKLKNSPNEKRWKEADYLLIQQCQSKRVTLISSSTGALVKDADIEDLPF